MITAVGLHCWTYNSTNEVHYIGYNTLHWSNCNTLGTLHYFGGNFILHQAQCNTLLWVLQLTWLYYTAVHCMILHGRTPYDITWPYTAWYYTAVHCMILHSRTLHDITRPYTAWPCYGVLLGPVDYISHWVHCDLIGHAVYILDSTYLWADILCCQWIYSGNWSGGNDKKHWLINVTYAP